MTTPAPDPDPSEAVDFAALDAYRETRGAWVRGSIVVPLLRQAAAAIRAGDTSTGRKFTDEEAACFVDGVADEVEKSVIAVLSEPNPEKS